MNGSSIWSNGAARLLKLVVLVVAVLGVAAANRASIITLSDQNSTAQVNVGSQAGMYNWTVDGRNMLNQQWFWLGVNGVNNGAPTAINNISAPTVYNPNSSLLEATYGNANYSVEVEYLLTGSALGSGQSDIGESIRLANTSATTQTFRLYEYSDVNLGESANSIQLGKNLRGLFDLADEKNNSGNALSETVATPGANYGEAETAGITLAKLNNGSSPVTLSDNTSVTAGPSDVTWAFEWDITLLPGMDFLISKDKEVNIVSAVPEPSTFIAGLLLAIPLGIPLGWRGCRRLRILLPGFAGALNSRPNLR